MALLAPVTWRTPEEHRRILAERINGLIDGMTNAAGTVTLTVSSATTVVTDARVGADSVITFMPTTLNEANEMSTLRVTSRGDGTFTITHTNTAEADRTFAYAISGTGRGA